MGGLFAMPGKLIGRALSIIPSVLGGNEKTEEKPAAAAGDDKPAQTAPVVEQKSSGLCGLGICCF